MQFFLDARKEKEEQGAKSGLYGGWPINSTFWSVKKALVRADAIRPLFFVFLISPKTLGKQIVVYHSELTVLRCLSGTVAT